MALEGWWDTDGEVRAAGRGTVSTVPWAQGRATLQNLKLPGRGEHAD